MKLNFKNGNNLGFTLVEFLIVLGILAILSGIIISTFVAFKKEQALDKDTELVVEVLQQARSQTLSSKNSSQYGVHFDSTGVTIFIGTTYSAGTATNQFFPLFSTDTIFTISLNGGGSEVIFNRLSGESDQFGTIVVSSASTSRTRTVTIYKTGLVEST